MIFDVFILILMFNASYSLKKVWKCMLLQTYCLFSFLCFYVDIQLICFTLHLGVLILFQYYAFAIKKKKYTLTLKCYEIDILYVACCIFLQVQICCQCYSCGYCIRTVNAHEQQLFRLFADLHCRGVVPNMTIFFGFSAFIIFFLTTSYA